MPKPTSAFSGFSSPNYTMVPDQLFDELLATLSGAELKVLLYIMRRTFGFKKDHDNISLNQIANGITTKDGRILDRGTGLSKSTVAEAAKSLEAKGAVIRDRRASLQNGDEATTYTLNFGQRQQGVLPPVSENRTPPRGQKIGHAPVRKSDTQETVIQNTEISNIRNGKNREEAAAQDIYAANTIVLEDIPHTPTRAPHVPTPRPQQQPTPIGALLTHRERTATAPQAGNRDAIMSRIEQFAEEFGDRATLKSSTSRAVNLYKRSGLSQEHFVSCLWEARTITRERIKSARSQRIATGMGYFFSVLTERLGLGTGQEVTTQEEQ